MSAGSTDLPSSIRPEKGTQSACHSSLVFFFLRHKIDPESQTWMRMMDLAVVELLAASVAPRLVVEEQMKCCCCLVPVVVMEERR